MLLHSHWYTTAVVLLSLCVGPLLLLCVRADNSRRAFYKEFRRVVEASDVVIQVRQPLVQSIHCVLYVAHGCSCGGLALYMLDGTCSCLSVSGVACGCVCWLAL
jgi:hypothetical protein